jgi:2,3-bisphosphoglycerate-independent phosphoglycerate mutase
MTPTGYFLADAIERALADGKSQYFMDPHVIISDHGEPIGTIQDRDSVIFTCRRGEREVQLTRAFVDPAFQEFSNVQFQNLTFVTMTRYHEMFNYIPVAFPPASKPRNPLGKIISRHDLHQLRVAESEKFAHVTYFLNGGRNEPFPGEDRIRIPSPKNVPFEDVPELNSQLVTEAVLDAMSSRKYHFIAVNFANGDIIGHLPDFNARIRCVEALDKCLASLTRLAARTDYILLVTADHGLLERGYDLDGDLNLHHTQNLVPFIFADRKLDEKIGLREGGTLSDIAPTVLEILGLQKPPVMTGESLLTKDFQKLNVDKKVLLIILDGWGLGPENNTNPIYVASTPTWDTLTKTCPHTQLQASGEAVGLLPGKPGNSEAGHMNIGAGRVVIQDDVRIARAIRDGTFDRNPAFLTAINQSLQNQSRLHLITMLSNRSSHGSINYPLSLLRLAKKHKLDRVYVHTIFNRPYRKETAPNLLRILSTKMSAIGLGKIATGVGRGYALDRDGDYQKTKKAYDALVFGKGKLVKPKIGPVPFPPG